jgi:hypothetical protein
VTWVRLSEVNTRVAGRVVPVVSVVLLNTFRFLAGRPADHDDGASWWF